MYTRVRAEILCSFQGLKGVLFSITESSAVATLANEGGHHSHSLIPLSSDAFQVTIQLLVVTTREMYMRKQAMSARLLNVER